MMKIIDDINVTLGELLTEYLPYNQVIYFDVDNFRYHGTIADIPFSLFLDVKDYKIERLRGRVIRGLVTTEILFKE